MAKCISLTLESGGQKLVNAEHLVSMQGQAEFSGLCRSLLTITNSVFNVREPMDDVRAKAGIVV